MMPIAANTEAHRSELDDIDALLRTYRARILRLVTFAVRDDDAAATITQECFFKAYQARQQFRGDCSVSTWLTQIAYNLIRDHTKSLKFRFWRRAAATAVDAAESGTLRLQASGPEAQLLARERVKLVGRALADLSPKQRAVFLMRFVEEMEFPEIADASGMPVATVKTHLHRALKSVRKYAGEARL